ncbi:MAG: FAD-dependent oxidoreductase [Anaerolineales bacterium]|jgi:2,4-dienoyl-CoA reductase-like NADH-dependent reductase (Old Yellow Enzyme family)/thioredoxin reductase
MEENRNVSGRHPLYQAADKLKAAFLHLGYRLTDDGDGPEIEEVGVTFPTWKEPEEQFGWQNNPVLLADCSTLLRTRLLPAQLHALRQEPPIHLLAFGRAYCKDATTPSRLQMEGFVAEKDLTEEAWVKTWEQFAHILFGETATASFAPCQAGSFVIILQDGSGKKVDLGYTGLASKEAIEVTGVNVPAWVFVIDVERFAQQFFGLSDTVSLRENDVDFLRQFPSTTPAVGNTPQEVVVDTLRRLGYLEFWSENLYPDGVCRKMHMNMDDWDINNNGIPLVEPLGEFTAMSTVRTPALEEVLGENFSRGHPAARLFEINHIYVPVKGQSLPKERLSIAMGAYGGGVTLACFTKDVEAVLQSLGVPYHMFLPTKIAAAYNANETRLVIGATGYLDGNFGRIHEVAEKNFGIGVPSYMANLELETLVAVAKNRIDLPSLSVQTTSAVIRNSSRLEGLKYPHLLEPGKIGNWDLPNRIVMAPMGSLNATENGYVTPRTIEFYIDKAKGGMGLIVVEATYVDDKLSKGEDNSLGLYENGQVTGMTLLASAIHDRGVYCVLQLFHMGHQISLSDKKESLGPSTMVEMMGGVMPFLIRGMTKEEIIKLKDDFAMAAWRAKMAGFDGVEIHGAIGHLINMFCTPFFNHRTDEYGGSPENRIRLMVEIIEAIQSKCGRSFPIIARICGCDFDPDGITLEEGIIHAKILEMTGIRALHVVGGSNRNIRTINCMYDPRGDFILISEAMKKAGIQTPIIVDGGLTTPDIAERVLAEDKTDYIGLGRPMLADPDWARKLEENRPEDIVPCIRCLMGCVGTMEQFNASAGLRCSVNPQCNLTDYRKVAPLAEKKKVCIIGGGPGGMEAARLAKLRGHEVTLYERRKLGGTMHEAAFDLDLKGDIQYLITYYVTQIKKLGINVIYEEATAETILKGSYDAVIVATGARARKSTATGIDKPQVYTDLEFTGENKVEVGTNVLVVGGGVVAAEIAVSLARKGKHVILSTRRGSKAGMMEIAQDDSTPMQQRLIALLMQNRVEMKLTSSLTEVTGDGAILLCGDGKKNEIKCENVILCTGYVPIDGIYEELRGKVKELYKIGDCVKPRQIGDAVHEGWLVANRL